MGSRALGGGGGNCMMHHMCQIVIVEAHHQSTPQHWLQHAHRSAPHLNQCTTSKIKCQLVYLSHTRFTVISYYDIKTVAHGWCHCGPLGAPQSPQLMVHGTLATILPPALWHGPCHARLQQMHGCHCPPITCLPTNCKFDKHPQQAIYSIK